MRRGLILYRPMPLLIGLSWALAPAAQPSVQAGSDASADVKASLATGGVQLETGSLQWVDSPPHGMALLWQRPRALLIGRRAGERADIWLARARLSPEGRLLRLLRVDDLTNTSVVDEANLRVHGSRATWTIGDGEKTYRLELADLDTENAPKDWNVSARIQHAITNWQHTGQTEDLGRRSFKLDPPAASVDLRIDADRISLKADERRVEIPFDAAQAINGQRFVVEQERAVAEPGNLVTWAVDRVRDVAWFGDENMQYVKAVAFAGLDIVDRAVGRLRNDDSAERIAEELGPIASARAVSYPDPETHWPPEAMRPYFSEPLPKEGAWLSLDDDPFVSKNPGAPAPVVTTFIRTDEDRVFSRIFVALWDPRQVDLHMVPGTEEPQSSTGEPGSGRIPRDPALMTRLVAAFNGGFQSTHGDFGMMVERRVLVPPKPYAATVALLDDGTTGFGTWPNDESIAEHFVAFRQNLTPLVADGEFNPYHRLWWGGVPADWEDDTRTVRSGLCVTREGFVAYFYGSKVDHEHLGLAMQSARCTYGLHLDMNQGHTGLEFYRVARTESLPLLERHLESMWETQGPVPGLDGYRFRSRRLIRPMQLMHFPRYIRRGQRDFFYLTLRHLLPGDTLPTPSPAEEQEGTWNVANLPQHGWPYAVATSWTRPDLRRPETKVRLMKLDPKFVELGNASGKGGDLIVTVESAGAHASDLTLWHSSRRFVISSDKPEPGATEIMRGDAAPPSQTRAALTVCNDGMLTYAEVSTAPDPPADAALLDHLFDRIACGGKRLYFDSPVPIALGGQRDLSGHPARPGRGATRIVRRKTGETARLFPNTPVLPRAEWSELQRQRRFFPRDESPASAAQSG